MTATLPARVALLGVVLTLASCSGGAGSSTTSAASQPAQSAESESTIDGTTVHVAALQTSLLAEPVARQYGIERSPTKVMLLVNVRGAGNGQAPSITATVTDLQEHTSTVALREVHVAQPGESTIDYLGMVDVSLPDTLRFAVNAKREGSTATVKLSRDFAQQ